MSRWVAQRVKVKATVMDADAIRRSMQRIAHEIVERNKGVDGVVLVGIVSRGDVLAQRLASLLRGMEGVEVPCGRINPAGHRDDLHLRSRPDGQLQTALPEIDGRTVVMVDDVVWHGRTVRAAMDALMEHGRPRAVQLAVLIDRGHRELPIRPDYVGKNVPTAMDEMVVVNLGAPDEDSVVIVK